MTRPHHIHSGNDRPVADGEQPRPVSQAPRRQKVPRRAPKQRRRSLAARVISLEASAALHLALLLLFISMPKPASVPVAEEPKQEPIPVEVAFENRPMTMTPKAAIPAPKVKPQPVPVPKAPERPVEKPHVEQAAAPKPLPPKQAVRHAAPAPKPAQKAFEQPKAVDLQALLQQRRNQGSYQEAQRLSHLQAPAHDGAEESHNEPVAGAPQGKPITDASGMSGDLSSRIILSRVYPKYPKDAEAAGDEGNVRLRVWVSPRGRVTNVEVVESSGRGSFDRAAAAALRQWVFNALEDGTAGDQWGVITLNFQLR